MPSPPYFVMVPDTLKSVSFIEKDSKRFPDTMGWAYAQFLYDAASDTFKPEGNDAKCGHVCHTTVAAKDYIFTAYPPEVSGGMGGFRRAPAAPDTFPHCDEPTRCASLL
jgi:Cytochrome P460